MEEKQMDRKTACVRILEKFSILIDNQKQNKGATHFQFHRLPCVEIKRRRTMLDNFKLSFDENTRFFVDSDKPDSASNCFCPVELKLALNNENICYKQWFYGDEFFDMFENELNYYVEKSSLAVEATKVYTLAIKPEFFQDLYEVAGVRLIFNVKEINVKQEWSRPLLEENTTTERITMKTENPKKQLKKQMKKTVKNIMRIEDEINKIHATMAEMELLLKKVKEVR